MSEESSFTAESSEENHPAILILHKLLEENKINAETYNSLRFKFKKLHQAFSQSCATEQTLLRRTRELNKELKSQKLTIQNSAAQQEEHRTALTALRQNVTNIQSELESTYEQIETTNSNSVLKTKEREKLRDKVAKARDDQRLKLEPLKRQVQIENTNLTNEIAARQKTIQTLKSQADDLASSIKKSEEKMTDIERRKKEANQKMLEISAGPIKTRQKASAVEASHNSLLSEEKAAITQLQSAEEALQSLHTQAHDFETEHQHILNDIDGMLQSAGDLKIKAESLRQQSIEQQEIKKQKEYECRGIMKQISEADREISDLGAKLESIGKDIQKKQKDITRTDETISQQRLEKTDLESQLKTLTTDKEKEEDRIRSLNSVLSKAVEAKEDAFKALQSVEGQTKEVLSQIRDASKNKDRKQAIHDQLSKKEHELEIQLAEASLIRDRKAREMAAMKKKTVDAKTLAMESNLDYLDLCRRQESISQKLKDFSDLYEKVKLDRNRYVNTIQTSRQLIVELREKIHILENEVEVLRREFETVDADVKLKKSELVQAFKRRDATKGDLKKAESYQNDLEKQINFQANETKRLSSVLSSIEDSISHQQDRYSFQTSDCARIQRVLIDKQDELCMIREQLNRHEEVLKRGEIALRERDEEAKLLNLQLNDFERQIVLMKRKIPQMRAYDEEISDLDRQLERERTDVDEITKKLESPDLKERERSYCGKDFTREELEQKVATYEQRKHAKEEQLWEKQILLKEIEGKIEAISADAEKDISKTEKVFRKSGNLRADSMALRRKKMAAISEMALYEAQSKDLQEQKEDMKTHMEEAGERSRRDESYDEYAEKMLKMHVRDEENAKKEKSLLDEDEDEDKGHGRQKFDAYPTADGLSRPYGAFPVFQPGVPSGQLRHFRKETQRPIEL